MFNFLANFVVKAAVPESAGENSRTITTIPKGTQFSGLSGLNIGQIVQGLITLALVVAAVIFFFMLVVGGIRWIISGGDKGQTEGARGQITAALIGLVIVFAAWAIASVLSTFFGIDLFTSFTLPNITE
ncbi:hypothetical protein A2125_01250 [Candidatus Woesebacteria bacterium GWB1_43_5]|uniref:Uncharacterized protein n=1 Tax=Candidatus Woesebacteria bacterium GWB1_43_5 TaxID=1802474 RepID=A0A1F7WRN7_9BACT|nr:MAG: hypothetical protein A2125_01250 [Candidatus Woesebacteria bacterium GWB1_43_5]